MFEAKWRAATNGTTVPSSTLVDSIDFGDLSPYLLRGEFTRATGPMGEGARMDIDHAGKGIAERLNVDITGFEYFRRLLPDDRELIVSVFNALFDYGCGRWRVMFYRFDKGLRVAVDTSFFPYRCAHTGCERVCALIVPATHTGTQGGDGRAYAAESGPSAEWIDLGTGVVPESLMLSLERG